VFSGVFVLEDVRESSDRGDEIFQRGDTGDLADPSQNVNRLRESSSRGRFFFWSVNAD